MADVGDFWILRMWSDGVTFRGGGSSRRDAVWGALFSEACVKLRNVAPTLKALVT